MNDNTKSFSKFTNVINKYMKFKFNINLNNIYFQFN